VSVPKLRTSARCGDCLRRDRHRPIALLSGVALAAVVAGAVVTLTEDSAYGPAAPGFAPLRVSSGEGVATGFAVADGRVVTVAHVVDAPVTVGRRRARVVRIDRQSDLALLSVPGLGAPAADSASVPAAASASISAGEHLRVIRLHYGRSSSLSVHVRRSIVAHVRAPGAARALVRPALELSVPARLGYVAPGDSGAAVVTDSGEVAGILFAVSRDRPGTAYAVDASRLRRLLGDSWKRG
jgi:S1-C subfamily serine protease